MEARAGSVLAHDPGVGVADFFHRMRCEADEIGIPLPGCGVGARHAVSELHERVLDVAWFLFVVKIFGELLIGEMATEPRVPPEKERHEDDEPAGGEEQYFLRARHAALWLRVRLRCLGGGGFQFINHAWDQAFLNSESAEVFQFANDTTLTVTGKFTLQLEVYSTSASRTRSCSR